MIKKALAAILLAVAIAAPAPAQTTPVYKDPSAPLEARVNDLFSQLTQGEKLSLLSGTGFTTQPIPRLGVPPMGMADAGQGVRGGANATQGPATLFPAEVDMRRAGTRTCCIGSARRSATRRRTRARACRCSWGPISISTGRHWAVAIPRASPRTLT